MSKRAQYLKTRDRLMAELGERCAKCSRTDLLHFDCIEPTGRTHHGLSLYDRMRYYERQFSKGNLQLLCPDCHEIKSVEDTKRIAREREIKLLTRAAAENAAFVDDCAPGLPTQRRYGPEPSATDWAAWCRWHRGEKPE